MSLLFDFLGQLSCRHLPNDHYSVLHGVELPIDIYELYDKCVRRLRITYNDDNGISLYEINSQPWRIFVQEIKPFERLIDELYQGGLNTWASEINDHMLWIIS